MIKEIDVLSLGFSPCPNDTFIFHALVTGQIPTGHLRFAREILADVETLNEWAFSGRLDVTKLSFHALGHLTEQYLLLTSGAALGRGCGPLLIAAEPLSAEELAQKTIAVPGRFTTAAMLLKLWAPGSRTVAMSFEKIIPGIKEGRVDAGVIIHESRFTYEQHGLVMIEDLGAWWEAFSGLPIPLGGIAARRSLGIEVIGHINECIRASVSLAIASPDLSLPYIKKHAQELDEGVIRSHINLYVNDFTKNLGDDGQNAVAFFLTKGHEAGLFPRPRDDFFLRPGKAGNL